MSLQYRIISPVQVDIMGESVTDAIKNFIKMNHTLAINNLILQDERKRMYARIRYFQEENKHKVGIDVYPTVPISVMNSEFNPRSVSLNVPMQFKGTSGLNMITQPVVVDGEVKTMPLYSFPGYKF
jgi:hypothetical protein